jgi:hypothetical protein
VPELAPLHPVNRRHLDVMTDAIGIMQHAIGSRPDPAHGHCVDDVARALQVDLLHERELGWPAVAAPAERSLDFLVEAFDDTTGRFRNFRSVDGAWTEGVGSEDCHGRAFHALGDVIADVPDARMVRTATSLFERALPAATELTALRAQASVLLGCAAKLGAAPDSLTEAACLRLADAFLEPFPIASSPWPWPESSVTYEGALLPRALIVTGRALASEAMIDTGLNMLDWLIQAQIAQDGQFSPVGNEWWPRDGVKSQFDQQPIEATAMLLAADSAYLATGDGFYRTAMERAYAWFLGGNDLGVAVADPLRGAGYDGLTPRGVNTNQGAESTLMWLSAAEHIRAIRAGRPTARPRTGRPTARPRTETFLAAVTS